jgi:Protein of unknown function (DUF1553)/Protein of unknown function (DUF1549)
MPSAVEHVQWPSLPVATRPGRSSRNFQRAVQPAVCRLSGATFLVLVLFFGAVAACVITAHAGEIASPEETPDPEVYGIRLSEEDYNHWSFKPIVEPALPAVTRDEDWVRQPLDRFILEKLHAKGFSPSPPAEPRVWLRRVYLDLIGLPPTPAEVDAFLAEPSESAREKTVDRLLADPNYGIRWGRRWLDVVRYADTNGYERDGNKPNAWRYRDYVIDAFNADKPFDRFLTEQLAGDELDDSNAETMIATTFLRLGTWDDEPADPLVDRYEQLDDILGTVSATFMGLTLRCARCHNHKFEPLSQLDYARMLALFDPLKRPQVQREEFDLPVGTRQELERHAEAQTRHEAALRGLEEPLKALETRIRERYFETGPVKLSSVAFAAHRTPADQRNDEQKKVVSETQKQFAEDLALSRTPDEQKQQTALQEALKLVRAAVPAGLPRAYIWRESEGEVPVTQVFRRGNPTTPAGKVTPGVPAIFKNVAFDMPASAAKPVANGTTTQRRLALARWLTHPDHPLTARVIANRIWQGHFGEGLAASENDFGVMGTPPAHPELLDWLSLQLRRGGWRLKPLHRMIVLSGAYGQSSAFRDEPGALDPDGQLLWRYPYRRLDAEALRDQILAVTGRLNRKMAGLGVYPKIAREVLEGQSRPGDGWGAYNEQEASRRSIYIHVKRSLLVPELEVLDFADTTTSCEQRSISTMPTQALTLMNGEFLNDQARHFARRIIQEAGDEPARRIELAYRLALGRMPEPAEATAMQKFLALQTQRLTAEEAAAATPRDAATTALEALCLILLNLNEFAYVD